MTLAVGLDVGNGKCVLAVSRNEVVDAVLNEETKRETPVVVHFAADHRLFGSACPAADHASTSRQLKRLFMDNYETSVGYDGGFRQVQIFYRKENRSFNAPEMLAMLLGHVKRSAERTLGTRISACVLGVPSYFNDRQRKAWQNAAAIAGFEPLKLLREGEATATEYDLYRSRSSTSVVVVFVDIGHCDTQVTVSRFQGGGGPEVIGEASDANLGGRDIDDLIFQYLAKRLKDEHQIDMSKNTKWEMKLRAASEKAKKVLSANREAHVTVDWTAGDDDPELVITRQQLEEFMKPLLAKILEKCQNALDEAGWGKTEVDSVELVGSGSLVPAISVALTRFFGRDMSRTLNGSESVARGCALLCERLIAEREEAKAPKDYRFGNWLWTFFLGFLRMICPFLPWQAQQKEDEVPKLPRYVLEARDREQILLRWDEAIERAKRSRNDLESLIYSTISKIERKGSRYSPENEILDTMRKMEDWLEGDGDNVSEQIYKEKIRQLHELLSGTEYAVEMRETPSLADESQPLLTNHSEEERNKCRCKGWLMKSIPVVAIFGTAGVIIYICNRFWWSRNRIGNIFATVEGSKIL